MEGLSVYPMPPAVHDNKVLSAQYQSHLSAVIWTASLSKPNFNSNYFLNQIFNSNYVIIQTLNSN